MLADFDKRFRCPKCKEKRGVHVGLNQVMPVDGPMIITNTYKCICGHAWEVVEAESKGLFADKGVHWSVVEHDADVGTNDIVNGLLDIKEHLENNQ